MKLFSIAVLSCLASVLVSPVARAQDGKLTVANIVFQDDQYFRLSLFGARDAARKLGVEVREGNSQNKLDKERQLVDTYIAAKVDAIILSPLSKKASVETVKRAKSKGVAVVLVNTTIEADLADASVQFDDADMGHQTGAAAAKYINQKLNGNAKVAILQFKSQVPEQSAARVNGFRDALKDLPGVEFVADQDAWLTEMAVKKASDILTAHPDLDIIYAANEGGTVGSALAVKNSGRAGRTVVFGINASEQIVSFLRSSDNILQAVCDPPPFAAGSSAMEVAVKVCRKEAFEKSTQLKGTLLTRESPAGIDEYEKNLKDWMAKGSQ
jgi:simple sugar transport system substrate-binding protein/ribose transport system substrate-binding protein